MSCYILDIGISERVIASLLFKVSVIGFDLNVSPLSLIINGCLVEGFIIFNCLITSASLFSEDPKTLMEVLFLIFF